MIIKKAGLALEPGSEFGDKDEGFMRLNFGCPRSILAVSYTHLTLPTIYSV